MNATVTVTYDGKSVTFELDGTEMGYDSAGGRYLTNASRAFIADNVEDALKQVTA